MLEFNIFLGIRIIIIISETIIVPWNQVIFYHIFGSFRIKLLGNPNISYKNNSKIKQYLSSFFDRFYIKMRKMGKNLITIVIIIFFLFFFLGCFFFVISFNDRFNTIIRYRFFFLKIYQPRGREF